MVNQLPEGNIGGDDDRLHGLRVCPVFVEEPSLLCNQVIKGKLSDNSEFHPAPGEKGQRAPPPCREKLRGLQNPCECGLNDPETPDSFPSHCHKGEDVIEGLTFEFLYVF